jgi:hypothetical protein
MAVVDEVDAQHDIEKNLQLIFPGKYTLLENKNIHGRAGIDVAVTRAVGRFLLIVDQNIVFHDPRSLEVLCRMADHDNVASASCILIKEAAEKSERTVQYRSGGIYPLQTKTGDIACSELDTYAVFPCATYPVAANSSLLSVARTDIWKKLHNSETAGFLDEYGDIVYGVNAVNAGYLNLCTSIVSAGLHKPDDLPYAGVEYSGMQADSMAIRKISSSIFVLKELNG